ncbi:MAG: hypothetical protein HY517_03115 [Candidatus Aenigmarchaeota archaeon]|nr:hypothetical protein [Candidatus Aenigmarchaeota archaeon]
MTDEAAIAWKVRKTFDVITPGHVRFDINFGNDFYPTAYQRVHDFTWDFLSRQNAKSGFIGNGWLFSLPMYVDVPVELEKQYIEETRAQFPQYAFNQRANEMTS